MLSHAENFQLTTGIRMLGPRYLTSLLYRMRVHAWKTKYVLNIKCICSETISIQHAFFECPNMTSIFEQQYPYFSNMNYKSTEDILCSRSIDLLYVAKIVLDSPIGMLL